MPFMEYIVEKFLISLLFYKERLFFGYDQSHYCLLSLIMKLAYKHLYVSDP